MALTWTDPQPGHFKDAYLDWSSLLQARRAPLAPADPDHGDAFEPIFVRLENPQSARSALKDAVTDPASPLIMDPHELQMLDARIAGTAPSATGDEEYALYRRRGTPDSEHQHLFAVLDTGVPVALPAQAAPMFDDPAPEPLALSDTTPIVAVIDDGIGFLNARFRRLDDAGAHRTRFAALWIQALEQRGAGAARVACGDVLSRAEIDAMLPADGSVDEPAAYAAVNTRLFGTASRRTTDLSSSHGTHVLDLAAGADPRDTGNPVRDWPLLGVQLPPEAVEDTSGTRFESYMVQGMRWILHQAGHLAPDAPVIVNISMGMLAGAKDGSRFSEYQIAREAAEWEAATGQIVRVVWSFGNNYRSDLVAQVDYPASQSRSATDTSLTWRVQPADLTASYLEIHTRGGDSRDLDVALTTPDGVGSGFAPLAQGEMRTLKQDGAPVARLYHVPARDHGATRAAAHYVLALAPSEGRKAGEPAVAAGAWSVGLRYGGARAVSVTLQVQRDDALIGYRRLARQSYLDHPGAYAWDPVRMQYTGLSASCPIQHAGTHNALATSTARQVISVGAARPSSAAPGEFRPAAYTAEGAALWSVGGPSVSALGDEGRFARGVLGSGTLTGSTRALRGTSMAAALVTRALGLSVAKLRQTAGGGSAVDDLDPAILTVTPVDAEDQPRLGSHVVAPPASRMARRA